MSIYKFIYLMDYPLEHEPHNIRNEWASYYEYSNWSPLNLRTKYPKSMYTRKYGVLSATLNK